MGRSRGAKNYTHRFWKLRGVDSGGRVARDKRAGLHHKSALPPSLSLSFYERTNYPSLDEGGIPFYYHHDYYNSSGAVAVASRSSRARNLLRTEQIAGTVLFLRRLLDVCAKTSNDPPQFVCLPSKIGTSSHEKVRPM